MDRETLIRMRAAYAKNPDDPAQAFEFGHALGQFSLRREGPEMDAIRQESLEVLGRLCERMEHLDPLEQWNIRRHYFLYSGQHLKNIALGEEEMARGNALGILSVGFGCLHQALDLLDLNRYTEARPYALRGSEAFRQLLAIDAPKHGRYRALSLTLAILGLGEEAQEFSRKADAIMPDDSEEHDQEVKRLLGISRSVIT